MPQLKIMSKNGHDVVEWSPEDKLSVDNVLERFNELVGEGKHVAYKNLGDGKHEKITSLDVNAQEDVVVRPQLVGG